MGYNKKVLFKATSELGKAKAPPKPRDIIMDPRGQWAHPGQPTRIPSSNITMQGVPYPVLGVDNTGFTQMMYPGAEYSFPGDYVDEYPQMKKGGSYPTLPKKKSSKKYSRSLTATNKLFAQSPLTKKAKSKKNKIFDPTSKYYQMGGEQEFIELDLSQDEIDHYLNNGYIVEDVASTIPIAQQGLTVSQKWEQETGTPWSEAKEKGYTTGSYSDNIALLDKLNSGKFSTKNDLSKVVSVDDPLPAPKKQVTPDVVNSINSAGSFNEAFSIARKTLGPNQIFEYKGRKYGTNLTGETFNPSEEVLNAAGMNTKSVKERLNAQNEELNSPYVSKKTVKLQPDKYESWDKIKDKNKELNIKSNADKIVAYKNMSNDGKNYVIVDKKKGLMHIYKPGSDKPLFSSAIDLGAQKGDAQTVTKVKDMNGDGIIDAKEAQTAKADFSAGNKMTGAGKYFISNIDKEGYEGLPLLNMMNENQYNQFLKTGNVENVATSFHTGYVKDDKSRVSNGCIRCNKTSLDNLTKYLENASEVYILPEDEGNDFVYENGKLNFRSKAKTNFYTYKNNGKIYKKENNQWYIAPKEGSKFTKITEESRIKELNKNATNAGYNYYVDSNGLVKKGQGINKTTNTLNYKPIKTVLDEKRFRDEVFTAFDFNDEAELKNVKKFAKSLESNKQKVMKAAKINGDVYNEIAKMTFGILGTETNFADTHSGIGDFSRAVKKSISPKSSSSPDYIDKYYTYGANKNTNSVGLTQIRWSQLNEDEKKALKEVGITSNKSFLDPEKAALGTAVVLGIRYNQQLSDKQKKDLWKHLPTKWNTRGNYASRVLNNSRFFSVQEKVSANNKFQTGGVIEDNPLRAYTDSLVSDPIYSDYIELDLTPEEIQSYKKGGWIVEDISVPQLTQAQKGGQLYTFQGTDYMKENGKWFKSMNGQFVPLTKGDVAKRSKVLESQAHKLSPYELQERERRQSGTSMYDALQQKVIPSETTQKVAKQSMQAEDLNQVAANIERSNAIKNIKDPGHLYKTMTDKEIVNISSDQKKDEAQKLVDSGVYDSLGEALRDQYISEEEIKVNNIKYKPIFVPGQGYKDPREAGPWNNYNDAPAQSVDWVWTLPLGATSAGRAIFTEALPSLASRIGSTNLLSNPATKAVLGPELGGMGELASKYGTIDKLFKLSTYAKTAGYAPKVISNIKNIGSDIIDLQGTGNKKQLAFLEDDILQNVQDIGDMGYDTFLDYGPSSKIMSALKFAKYGPRSFEGSRGEADYKAIKNLGNIFKRQEGGMNNDYIETELTPEEIQAYKDAGYIIEDLDKLYKFTK